MVELKRLGIVQPGRIGDIIICLPIAKWYADRGYRVIWPVADYILPHFKNYIHYVDFLPLPSLDSGLSRNIVYGNCNTIIDVTFTFPGANPFNDKVYSINKNVASFDQLKYEIAGVPFSEKWNLSYHRNIPIEQELWRKLNVQSPFTLAHLEGSNERRLYSASPGERIVEVGPMTGSLFDWLGVLEMADKLVAIDSCFANLVEQTQVFNKEKILLTRMGDVRPVYRNWNVL